MRELKVTIIIPIYNEEKTIENCLESLILQTYKPIEIILVDDGSNDKTQKIISEFKVKNKNFDLTLLNQKHQGPGVARNLGSQISKGEILVFVDADMTFEKNFIADLIKPILQKKYIGTFSKNELVENANNIWSIAWNIQRNCPKDRMLPNNYPDVAPVFRAILKSEFEKVDGFETTGEYTDDWSLSRKLGIYAGVAKGAVYYHSNPDSFIDCWNQARWIGKSEFITGNLLRKTKSILLYSFPISIIIGIYKTLIKLNLFFIFFKIIYDFAIWKSVIGSFFGETKTKRSN